MSSVKSWFKNLVCNIKRKMKRFRKTEFPGSFSFDRDDQNDDFNDKIEQFVQNELLFWRTYSIHKQLESERIKDMPKWYFSRLSDISDYDVGRCNMKFGLQSGMSIQGDLGRLHELNEKLRYRFEIDQRHIKAEGVEDV